MIWADQLVTLKDGALPKGVAGPGRTTLYIKERFASKGSRYSVLVIWPHVKGHDVEIYIPLDKLHKVGTFID